MEKFIVRGGKKLRGGVVISGAKNAALKMMAATIMASDVSYLNNVPRIADVETMKVILESLGAKIDWQGPHALKIDCRGINRWKPDPDLVVKMRSSIVLAGPLLTRFGKAEIARPGGCIIGARPVYEHWQALKQFGVSVSEKKLSTLLVAKDRLHGARIILNAMSVTATENVIMAAVLAQGKTEIRMAACEPEIQDLVRMLRKMGAKIKGEKTHIISITGVKRLRGARHRVIPDRIEAVTYALAGIITNGNVTVKRIIPDHLDIIFNRFDHAGINYKLVNCKGRFCDLVVQPPHQYHPIKIDARPYPGYPTDLQAPTAVLMSQLPRTSKIFETIYEGRLAYLKELKKMGAAIKIIDSHTAEITGPAKLRGAKIKSFDLRAGATLILAGLIADGVTEISNIGTIDRGYERIEYKLQKLGADIRRVGF